MTYAARVADAVNNDEWQKFRLSMKGQSTQDKITMLEGYYDNQVDALDEQTMPIEDVNAQLEVVKLRIDNYIKALCRGGQLDPGMTFEHFNDGCIRNHIRK